MNNLSWQYIAGFFDGEGHVAMHCVNNHENVRVMMAQSGDIGLSVLTEIQSWLDAQGIRANIYVQKARGNRKVPYQLTVQSRDSQDKFLKRIFPFLKIKRVTAQDILRYFILFPQRRKGVVASFIAKERGLCHA